MIRKFINDLTKMDRARKRMVLVAYDVVAMIAALWAAFSVRLGEAYWTDNFWVNIAALISVGVGLAGLYQLRVYHIVLRYFDLKTVSRIFFGAEALSEEGDLSLGHND